MLIIIKLVVPFGLYKISWIYHFVLLKGNTSLHTDLFAFSISCKARYSILL